MNNKFNRTKLFLLLIATSLFVACTDHKDYYDPDYVTDNPLEEVAVPEGFNWKTTLSNNVTVEVDDEFNGEFNYLIEIFDLNPITNSDAKMITNGTAKKGKPFVTKITVPNNVEVVFIKQTTPSGLVSVRSESTTTGTINCNFGEVKTKSSRSAGAMTRAGDWDVDFTEPDHNDPTYFPTAAPGGIDPITSTNASSLVEGGTYIINSGTPSSFALGSLNDITLYVTETATIQSISNLSGRKIFILPNVSFTVAAGINAATADWTITIGENAELKTGKNIVIEHNTKFYNLGTVTASSFKGIHNSVLYNTGKINLSETGTTAISMGSSTGNPLLYNVGNIEAAGGLYITSGSVVYNSGSASLKTGSMNIESSGNRFINDGEVTCAGKLRVAGTSKTQNNGTLTVGGETEISGGETWQNNGTWTTKTMTTKAYAGRYLNSCKLIVNEKFDLQQATFTNDAGAYVYATSMYMINTRVNLGSGSFFHVDGVAQFNNNKLSADKGFYATGEKTSLLKMTKAEYLGNWNDMVHYFGNMQIACDQHHPQRTGDQPWSLNDGAEFAPLAKNTVEIEKTECNKGSEINPGTPEDKDPEPIIDPFSYTYMFEDLWPLYGDYDMNDVVIRINEITKTPDADGKITSLSFDFNLKAVGAARSAAVALMLDGVNASSVASLTYSADKPIGFPTLGSGVESEQAMAVIPLISEVHRYLGRVPGQFINTEKGSDTNVSETPTVTVKVTFASPIADNIDATSFNVFIIADSDNGSVLGSARKEIHVVGYAPTDRADTFMFGNHSDNSLSGLYYSSKDNLAWGIVVSDDFRWPIETMNIQKAYDGFTEWITSGGIDNKDWWTTPKADAVF